MLTTLEELEALYGQPHERSVRKEIRYVNETYRQFIERSPFVVLATAGPEGLDCSPRGDAPGFVRIVDERTLVMPDRIGNNRVDSLRNILAQPHVGLLFIVPGVGETLRVNGRARISVDEALLESFAVEGKRPRTVVMIDVDAVYFHCSRALVRSKLWDAAQHVDRSLLPSAGEMLRSVSEDFDAVAYDRELPERLKKSLY
jgi:PPOX class probable FMN-dependent enzyme